MANLFDSLYGSNGLEVSAVGKDCTLVTLDVSHAFTWANWDCLKGILSEQGLLDYLARRGAQLIVLLECSATSVNRIIITRPRALWYEIDDEPVL